MRALSAVFVASLSLAGCQACQDPAGPSAPRGPRAKAGKAGKSGKAGARAVRLPPPPACFTPDGPTQTLSPPGSVAHHHPSAARLPDGGWLVAWQAGRDAEAHVEARVFGPDLAPRGDVHRVSAAAGATHPVAVAGDGGAWVAWTVEPQGAVHARALDPASGAPQADAVVVAPDGGAFPDGAWDGDAPRWLWTARAADTTVTWQTARPGQDPTVLGTPSAAGGPAAIAADADGVAHAAWSALTPAGTGTGTGTLYAGPVGGPSLALDTFAERRERTTLAFPDAAHLAVGWTRYPASGTRWAIGFTVRTRAGQPAGQQALDGARMLDLDGGDGALIAAWEQPVKRGMQRVAFHAFDATGAALCGPAAVDPQGAAWQARADVHLDGPGRAVVFWQEGPTRASLSVRARAVRWTGR